jgi:hypothetical protein
MPWNHNHGIVLTIDNSMQLRRNDRCQTTEWSPRLFPVVQGLVAIVAVAAGRRAISYQFFQITGAPAQPQASSSSIVVFFLNLPALQRRPVAVQCRWSIKIDL